MKLLKFISCALWAIAAFSAQPKHVVLITIDGGAAFFLEDPSLHLPNIRRFIHDGVWADSSESIFPSVTHPAHTTIITGVSPRVHKVLSNELFQHETGEVSPPNSLPHAQVVLAKSIFDTAKIKGLSTAGIFWPESIDDPSLDFNLTIRTEGKQRHVEESPWTKELRADTIPIDLLNRLSTGTITTSTVDTISILAACDVIERHKPNLIAIHLVNPDAQEHTFGPQHPIAQAAMAEADRNIGLIVSAVQKAGIADQTAFIVTADHGFASVHYQLNLRPYVAQAGLSEKIRLHHPGWSVFVQRLPAFDPKTDEPKLRQLFENLRKNPHVLRIFRSDEYPGLGLPRYEDSTRVPGQYLIVSDIDTFLVDEPGNSIELQKREHPAYSHGYLPQYPAMYPMLVLSGSGFKHGIRIGHVRSLDLAPTISHLLGLPPLAFEGRILTEALEE